eukprot:6090171-Alexandrium_andersonii.AAC.1
MLCGHVACSAGNLRGRVAPLCATPRRWLGPRAGRWQEQSRRRQSRGAPEGRQGPSLRDDGLP